MVPNTGRRHNLNMEAAFFPAERGTTSVPTVEIGGARVSVYADANGVLRVDVFTRAADDPRFSPGNEGGIRVRITMDNTLSLHC